MTDLPQPLTPADCNLKDFTFMPLDVNRLRDSDLASLSNGNEFRSAVLLWCASWHQVPSASLPDDDVVLAKLAGYGFVVREWKKVKKGALRGWVKCSDGRLYHPVVAEKAREAWDSKHQHAYDKLADRIRKKNKERNQKGLDPLEIPTFEEWKAAGMPLENELFPPEVKKSSDGIPAENPLKGQGQGQGQGQGNNLNPEGTTIGDTSTVVGAICVGLRRSGVQVSPHQLQVQELAKQVEAQTLTVQTILAAGEDARKNKPNERIGIGLVVAIITSWATKAKAMNVAGAHPPVPHQPARDAQRAGAMNSIGLGGHHDQQPLTIDAGSGDIVG